LALLDLLGPDLLGLVVLGLLEPESDEPAPLDGDDPSAEEEDEDDDDCEDDSDVGDERLSVR
jgi:hypothetical protein